jgi:hypothetical protein
MNIDMRPRVRDGWGKWSAHTDPRVPAFFAMYAIRCVKMKHAVYGEVESDGECWQFRDSAAVAEMN